MGKMKEIEIDIQNEAEQAYYRMDEYNQEFTDKESFIAGYRLALTKHQNQIFHDKTQEEGHETT